MTKLDQLAGPRVVAGLFEPSRSLVILLRLLVSATFGFRLLRSGVLRLFGGIDRFLNRWLLGLFLLRL